MKFRSLPQWLLLLSILPSWGCTGDEKIQDASPTRDAAAEPSVDPNSFPEVVATVNGTPILRTDLAARLRNEVKQRPNQPLTAEFCRSVLNDLVDSELLYQQSVAMGFAPSDEEVEERIAAIRSRFPSREEFEKTLESQGLDQQKMRKALKKDLGVGRMLEKEIISNVEVTEEQTREYFKSNADKMHRGDEIRVSHILIRVDRDAPEEVAAKTRRQAEELRRRIVEGEDFAKVARENSQDPGSAPLGGDLSWIARGDTVPAFEQAAYALQPGELSPVMRSPFGFHIIKQLERRPGKPLTFEEAKDEIAKFLQERAVQEQIGARVAELRSQAEIEIFI